MKGCLVLQRRFAYVGHAVARNLKERYGVTEFCGYVSTRQSEAFLKSQTDIAYGTLLNDEEIHERYKTETLDREYLASLEKTYGLPSLWPYLTVDRVLMSGQLVREYPYDRCAYTHEELLLLIQVYARALEKMLDEEKPDFLFCSVIGSVGSFLLLRMCQLRGIKVLFVNTGCIRDRWLLSEDYKTFTGVDRLFQHERERLKSSESRKKAEEFLRAFRERPIPHIKTTTASQYPTSRLKQFKFLNPKKGWNSLSTWLREVKNSFTDPSRHDYDYIGPWNYLHDLLKRKVRNLVGTDDLYSPFDPKENFAYFPLHYEPEVSLLLQAPYYTDQAHLIKQIAKSLPVQMTLYVKEHPIMSEYRTRRFYREIKKLPNVKLLPPTMTGFEILPHAKLIVTITGTSAWEGTFLKKPAIAFGHWFYNTLPFIKHCKEIEQLPFLIKEQLEHFAYDEEALLDFMAAVFEESVEVDLMNVWDNPQDREGQKQAIAGLADLLAKKLGLV